MTTATIGQRAPLLLLPSGDGRTIGLDDFRGKSNVILWFTKGMACAFCRQQMTQLARGYPQFRAQGAEILEVTPTKPDRARFYVEKFRIPFPYLCDPDHRARQAWGLGARSHSLVWYAKGLVQGIRTPAPASDFGALTPRPGEFPELLADDDMGFFIVDRNGIVRYALTGSYGVEHGVRQIPENEEILRALEECEKPPLG